MRAKIIFEMLGSLFVFLMMGVVSAPAQTCSASELALLKQKVPEGYRIYSLLKDKQQFLTWLKCDDSQLDLATAVHESVHVLTEENDAYPLINGTLIPRPHVVSAFAPPKKIASEMVKNFGPDDLFISTYLQPGAASSADDFMFLLDELNAYGHDLNTAVKLQGQTTVVQQVDHRDGLAAMMAFVIAYTQKSMRNDQQSWQGLQKETIINSLEAIWRQSEGVLTSSCGIPNFGTSDTSYIEYMCETKNTAALTTILKRDPICPKNCLVKRNYIGQDTPS
ncbi:hypothetical protein WKW50_24990 [Ochrobactrum sp. GPK 3]|uniref:hypothetical protein n=1 Tax=Brucella sp. 22210 TaxID=3453892 RepID=UPI0031384BDF